MEPKLLQEIASFSVAKNVWSAYVNCSTNSVFMQLCGDREKSRREIKNFLHELYPGLPSTLNDRILCAVYLIDKELVRWKTHLEDILRRFDDISWTSYFTIDRIRSQCTSKNFDLNDVSLCTCCASQYVDAYLSKFSSYEYSKLRKLFGPFYEHAVLYWHWYGRNNRRFFSHVWKYYHYYNVCTPIENVFKLAVYCEYESGVFHYWSMLTGDQQLSHQHLSVIIHMLAESDNLEFAEFNGLLPLDTFSFFWLRLSDHERFDAVKYSFVDFYRYMLYHEGGLDWVNGFLGTWIPFLTPLEYFKILRLSIDTNNLNLFEWLWKKKIVALSTEAVGNLLWTLLFHKDIDFKLSVMIINEYDNERKVMLLNELDKRAESVKLNFVEKIDMFLDAAALQHLRTNGSTRNRRRRHRRRRRSNRR